MAIPSAMFDQILSLARDDDGDSIRQLVGLGCPPTYSNRVGQTALHIGAIWGSMKAVKVLLECRADPNQANQLRGSTPLHAAAMGKGPAEKRAECVKMMIAFKANPQKADMGGELPIDSADDEILRLALGAEPLIVHKAVLAKDLTALTSALDQIRQRNVNLTIETADPKGETALHAAVRHGWNDGVKSLLQVKARVATQNQKQQTPLHSAVSDPRLMKVLLEAKASVIVDVKDADQDHDPRFSSITREENPYEHRTALHYAAQQGNVWAARLLLGSGADVNSKDSKQETPLHLCMAALKDDDEILEPGSGVRIDGLQKRPEWNSRIGSVLGEGAKDSTGSTRWPVVIDLAEGEMSEGVLLKQDNLQRLGTEMIDLLLEAKADVNLTNYTWGEGRTMLHEVARGGDASLVQKVIAARVDINRKDSKQGLSALHLAARSKQVDVIRVLVEARADLKQVTSAGKTAAELAKTNRASAEIVSMLTEGSGYVAEAAPVTTPQTIESLTAEQRALLFID